MVERLREIKFRAWNGKEMFNVDVIAISPCTWSCPDYGKKGVSLAYQPHITVMQYTGLKDKNGKEIYEGDIVTYEDAHYSMSENGQEFEVFRNLGSIEWDNEQAQFYVTNRQSLDLQTFFEYIDETEVIGSIYENPELLEGT